MSTGPGDHRAANAARMARWRAETGRTTTARVSLRGLGELEATLEADVGPDAAERLRGLLGDDVTRRARAAYTAWRAVLAARDDPDDAHDTDPDDDTASTPRRGVAS